MTEHTQKHQALWDWLYTCPDIQSLYFIQGEYDESHELKLNEQVVYTPQATGVDAWEKRYMRDKGIKLYSFAVSQYAPMVSQVNNNANITVINAFEKIVSWVEEQNRIKNHPLFPADSKILKVEAFPGTIAGTDEKGVKLQFITQIRYQKL